MRRSGKTTRLIDEAIQELFKKGELKLSLNYNVKSDFLDRDSTSENRAQRDFVDRLIQRLSIEHRNCCETRKQTDFVIITLKS